MTPNEDERQKIDLEHLEHLLRDTGLTTEFFDKSEQFPLNFLTVSLPADEEESMTATLQMMYIPTASTLEETNLLQFFASISDAPVETNTNLTAFMEHLNTRTPLGYFGLDREGKVFYRYVYAVPRFTVPAKAPFLEVLDLFTQSLLVFGRQLSLLARGDIDLQEAKEAVS